MSPKSQDHEVGLFAEPSVKVTGFSAEGFAGRKVYAATAGAVIGVLV